MTLSNQDTSRYHCMKTLLKPLLLAALVLSGQVALATPQADANYIAQRSMNPTALNDLRRMLKEPFVAVYFRPLSELGIEIVDMDRFVDLIPDEDIAPVLDRYMSGTARQYLSTYTPEQLSAMAALLRADPDTSMLEILSEVYQRKLTAALEQARTEAKPSGLDDPRVIELEELSVQLNAFNALFDDDVTFFFAPDTAASSIATLLFIGGYGREVAQLHREPNNPVTMAAIEAFGILRFANPVQRQTVLRQYSVSEDTGGVRFAKPLSRSTD